MEAQYDGSWVEGTFSGYEWLDPTEGCRLVWSRKWHAESCAARGHRNRFYQYYYTQIQHGDGLPPTVVETRYERRALRREIPRADAKLAFTPAPTPDDGAGGGSGTAISVPAPVKTPTVAKPKAKAAPTRRRQPSRPAAAPAADVAADAADEAADRAIERMLDQEPAF